MLALARRSAPALFLALVAFLPLARALSQGHALGPFDQIAAMGPWLRPAPERPWDVLQADAVLQFYAWRDLVFESWREGRVPFWNPYVLGGTPLLANSQSGALYPLHILAGVLGVPTALAITWLAWFHLWWGGLGVYRLARTTGASRLGASVGGALFASSVFVIAWAPLASVPTTLAWLPWALAFLVEVLRDPRRVPSALGFVASVACLLLGGHLQFAAYGVMALLGVGLALVFRRGRSARSLAASTALALGAAFAGALLAAPHLLPVLELGALSHRRAPPTAEGYRAYAASAIPLREAFVRWVDPFACGNPAERAGADLPISAYWPSLSERGANFAERASTWGPVAVFSVALALVRRKGSREAWAVGFVLVALGLALGLGSPVNRWLYDHLPGWSATGSPGRAVVLFVLGGCYLAAFGPSALRVEARETSDRSRRAAWIAGGATLVLLVSGLLWPVPPAPSGISEELWRSLTARDPVSLVGILLLVGLMTASAPILVGRRAPLWLIFPLVGGVLFHETTFLPSGDSRFLHGSASASPERIAVINDGWELLVPAPALAPPNSLTPSRIREVGGYDSLIARPTVEWLREIVGRDPAPPANGNMMFIWPSADPERLREAGVSRVWSRVPLPRFGEPTLRDGVLEYELAGAARVAAEGGRATIERDDPGRIIVRMEGAGRLTVKERALPGWRARFEGSPIPLVGERWLEVDVPAAGTVTLTYRPSSWERALALSAGGAALCLVGVIAWVVPPLRRRVGRENLPSEREKEVSALI